MRTIDKIITKKDTSAGAPMGRFGTGDHPAKSKAYRDKLERIKAAQQRKNEYVNVTEQDVLRKIGKRVYDCKVPMSADGAYDTGGAYWGIGPELRVQYTKDLSYIRFYRRGDKLD